MSMLIYTHPLEINPQSSEIAMEIWSKSSTLEPGSFHRSSSALYKSSSGNEIEALILAGQSTNEIQIPRAQTLSGQLELLPLSDDEVISIISSYSLSTRALPNIPDGHELRVDISFDDEGQASVKAVCANPHSSSVWDKHYNYENKLTDFQKPASILQCRYLALRIMSWMVENILSITIPQTILSPNV